MTTPEDIASQVVDLTDTEVLVLRLPDGLATTDRAFQNFASELRAILGQGRTVENPVRIVVLTHDMELETLASGDLAKIGLRATAKHPYKSPELLFTSGPLRQAARAGWESANGNGTEAEICVETAGAELAQEISMQRKLDIRTL